MGAMIEKTFNLQPTTFKQAMEYAELIAKSSLVPKDYKDKPGDVLIAIQMGQEIGLKPLQALQNIATINGRPSIWGDAMLALVRSHPDFEYINEKIEGTKAYCFIKRKNEPELVRTFSMDDAKKAGLTSKQGPWQQYPERMLQLRARGFALRDAFTDALKGIITREEAEDMTVEPIIKGESFKVSEIKNIVDSQESGIHEHYAIEHQETVIIPAVTFEKLQKEFEAAKSISDLKITAAKVKEFDGTDEQKSQLRSIYDIRKDEIKSVMVQNQ